MDGGAQLASPSYLVQDPITRMAIPVTLVQIIPYRYRCVWYRTSLINSDWPWFYYIILASLEILCLLPQPSECSSHQLALSHLVGRTILSYLHVSSGMYYH